MASKPDAWMPINIGDFLWDTMRLSTIEIGALHLLRLHYWRHGPLRNDDMALAKICLISTSQFRKMKASLMYLFDERRGHLHLPKLDNDLERAASAKAKPHWSQKLSPAERTALKAARRARKRMAMPLWLTPDDRSEMAAIYQAARHVTNATGIPHDVDHIIPLASEVVCGLHVPWNLQVLKSSENRTKSNWVEQ